MALSQEKVEGRQLDLFLDWLVRLQQPKKIKHFGWTFYNEGQYKHKYNRYKRKKELIWDNGY